MGELYKVEAEQQWAKGGYQQDVHKIPSQPAEPRSRTHDDCAVEGRESLHQITAATTMEGVESVG